MNNDITDRMNIDAEEIETRDDNDQQDMNRSDQTIIESEDDEDVAIESENNEGTTNELEIDESGEDVDDERPNDVPRVLKIKHDPNATNRNRANDGTQSNQPEEAIPLPAEEGELDRTDESTVEVDDLIDPDSLFYITEDEEENETSDIAEIPVSHRIRIIPKQRSNERKKSGRKIKIILNNGNEGTV